MASQIFLSSLHLSEAPPQHPARGQLTKWRSSTPPPHPETDPPERAPIHGTAPLHVYILPIKPSITCRGLLNILKPPLSTLRQSYCFRLRPSSSTWIISCLQSFVDSAPSQSKATLPHVSCKLPYGLALAHSSRLISHPVPSALVT